MTCRIRSACCTAPSIAVWSAPRYRERLLDWRRQLDEVGRKPPSHPVFLALGQTLRELNLPKEPFDDLLSAFLQDVAANLIEAGKTANVSGYMAFGPPGSEDFFRRNLPAQIGLVEVARFYVRDDGDNRGGAILLNQDGEPVG